MTRRLQPESETSAGHVDPVTPEDVRQVMDRVLNSKYFSQAPKKRRFVELICDYYLHDRAYKLNEYLIGRQVYERGDRYSPSEDPIVRVAAHDVRRRLEQYYQHEGKDDEVRLEIPVGSYEPVFRRAPLKLLSDDLTLAAASPGTDPGRQMMPPAGRDQARPRRSLWLIAGGLLAGALLAFGAWRLAVSLPSQQESPILKEQSIYGPVWGPFFASDDPTLLVLSNPPVYTVINQADPEVLQKKSIELPPKRAQELLETLGDKGPSYPPKLSLYLSPAAYTGIGEAIGVHDITDLFRSRGLGVTLKQSRNMTAEDLRGRNLILLGGEWSNEWSGKLPVDEDFYFTPKITIGNRRPQPGEQSEYRTKFNDQNGQIQEDYALVTVKPATLSKNTIMILEGIRSVGTGAAADFVTTKTSLTEINRRLQQLTGKKGLPKYYQALLKVGVESQIPTTISLISVHEIRIPEN